MVKYWDVASVNHDTTLSNCYTVTVKLIDHSLLNYFENKKVIVFFERISILGIFELTNKVSFFRTRQNAFRYLNKNTSRMLVQQDDEELSFKSTIFCYPLTALIEDDFTKGITFEIKKLEHQNQLIESLNKSTFSFLKEI